jgi:hypothetical protein
MMQITKTYSRFARLLALAAAACLPQWALAQSSANYTMQIRLLNAGIGSMVSTDYRLASSLGGGYYTGPDSSADFRLSHGLWMSSVVPAPVFLAAASRRVHGAAGAFALPLSLVTPPAINHNPTTEPRQGPNQTIVFTFDKPLNAATVSIDEGTATAAAPTFSGNDVVVALTGVTNQQYVTVSLGNVTSADGGTGGSGSVRVGFLLGDANQNRVVSLADLAQVNQQLAQPVTAANYLRDVNASGTLTVADKGITNANLTKGLPTP